MVARFYFLDAQYWVRIGTGHAPLRGPFGSLVEARNQAAEWTRPGR